PAAAGGSRPRPSSSRCRCRRSPWSSWPRRSRWGRPLRSPVSRRADRVGRPSPGSRLRSGSASASPRCPAPPAPPPPGPRGAGLAAEVVLGNAAHPFTLLQTLVPDLFGALSPPAEFRWGGRFFTKGLPYFLSLYVGPLSLALAAAGVSALPRAQRWTLL